jgi:hypothetical protein
MIFPNAFIVGAPKCATTAMAQYLAAHPEIGSLPKEPHRFGSDLPIARRPMTPAHYEARSRELGENHHVVLDASVFYLLSTEAAREIHAFNPDAKIIIMLRQPVDMLISLHQQVLKSLNEDIEDFAEALAAEPDRKAGRRIPSSALLTCGLLYREVASFADQVARYQAVFPPEQIKIVLFDDVKADAKAAYEDVCAFLGVTRDAAQTFEPVNEAGSVRNRLLVEVQRRLLFRYGIYGYAQRLLPKTVRAPLWRLWQGMLYKPLEKRSPDPALLASLHAEFTPEISRLESLIGRDLTSWKVREDAVAG